MHCIGSHDGLQAMAYGYMGYCHVVATFLPSVYALFAIRIKGLKVWEGIAIVLRVGFAVHTLALAIHIYNNYLYRLINTWQYPPNPYQ